MSVRPVRGGPTKKATGGSNHNIAIKKQQVKKEKDIQQV